MLLLVQEKSRKKELQAQLVKRIKSLLTNQGTHNIGYPGGNSDHTIYSEGQGKLWAAFGKPSPETSIPRYWNSFGLYDDESQAQSIIVEINIATDDIGMSVAGFFAEDTLTGDVYLMHSGKIGGGHPRVGKTAFLVSSKAHLIKVSTSKNKIRLGIPICNLDGPDLIGRLEKFVRDVSAFKQRTRSGELETKAFQQQVEEYERYIKEFEGVKKGSRQRNFEYLTYHGEVVQKLFEERAAKCSVGENVYNNPLVDLYVRKAGVVTEIYEIKTTIDRQTLYTAIGQLLTHSSMGNNETRLYLVVPSDDPIPQDFLSAIDRLGLLVITFTAEISNARAVIRLNNRS